MSTCTPGHVPVGVLGRDLRPIFDEIARAKSANELNTLRSIARREQNIHVLRRVSAAFPPNTPLVYAGDMCDGERAEWWAKRMELCYTSHSPNAPLPPFPPFALALNTLCAIMRTQVDDAVECTDEYLCILTQGPCPAWPHGRSAPLLLRWTYMHAAMCTYVRRAKPKLDLISVLCDSRCNEDPWALLAVLSLAQELPSAAKQHASIGKAMQHVRESLTAVLAIGPGDGRSAALATPHCVAQMAYLRAAYGVCPFAEFAAIADAYTNCPAIRACVVVEALRLVAMEARRASAVMLSTGDTPPSDIAQPGVITGTITGMAHRYCTNRPCGVSLVCRAYRLFQTSAISQFNALSLRHTSPTVRVNAKTASVCFVRSLRAMALSCLCAGWSSHCSIGDSYIGAYAREVELLNRAAIGASVDVSCTPVNFHNIHASMRSVANANLAPLLLRLIYWAIATNRSAMLWDLSSLQLLLVKCGGDRETLQWLRAITVLHYVENLDAHSTQSDFDKITPNPQPPPPPGGQVLGQVLESYIEVAALLMRHVKIAGRWLCVYARNLNLSREAAVRTLGAWTWRSPENVQLAAGAWREFFPCTGSEMRHTFNAVAKDMTLYPEPVRELARCIWTDIPECAPAAIPGGDGPWMLFEAYRSTL